MKTRDKEGGEGGGKKRGRRIKIERCRVLIAHCGLDNALNAYINKFPIRRTGETRRPISKDFNIARLFSPLYIETRVSKLNGP